MLLLGAIVVSFLVTMLFMLALRPLAFSFDLVDRPGGRKAHIGEVPIIGGVCMFMGVIVGLTLLPELNSQSLFLLLAGGVLVVVGLIDDRFSLSPTMRLGAQLAACLILIYGGGLLIADIGNPLALGTIELGPFAVVGTVLITLSVVNAFNMVDGVDGLAGCMAVVSLTAIALISLGSPSMAAVSAVSVAAISGFLLFNFPVISNRRVRSFMGDSGSTFIGLIVVWVTVGVSQGGDRITTPVIGLWFAAVPIFDLFTCFVRRLARGKSPFTPGRDHFHHVLKRGGMRVRAVLFTLTGLQALYAGIGLVGHFAGIADPIMFGAWAVLGISQRRVIRAIALAYRKAHWGKPVVHTLV